MSAWDVTVQATALMRVTVEAETEEEARKKGLELWNWDNLAMVRAEPRTIWATRLYPDCQFLNCPVVGRHGHPGADPLVNLL